MVYYGLSMDPSESDGDLYRNFIFGALMEIPAVIIVYLFINRAGRKPLLAGGFIMASLFRFAMLFIKDQKSKIFNKN